jgi:DNA-binding MarR family transcriptional regulator
MSSALPERAVLLSETGDLGRELGARTVMFHTAVAERLGLNATDHKALDLLSRAGAMTAGELAELTGLTTGAITGVIDRLEQGGYVRRAKDPLDRRKVVIEPVRDHERMRELDSIFAALSQQVADLAGRYSDAELAVIHDFLTRSSQVLQEQTAQLRREAPHGTTKARRLKAKG